MSTPLWADQLLTQILIDEGRRSKPNIHWWTSTKRFSASGNFSRSYNRIRITTGTNQEDHKQVFLHEIAHWLTKRGHSKRFWIKLNELLIRYDCYTEQYRAREERYKLNSARYLTGRTA